MAARKFVWGQSSIFSTTSLPSFGQILITSLPAQLRRYLYMVPFCSNIVLSGYFLADLLHFFIRSNIQPNKCVFIRFHCNSRWHPPGNCASIGLPSGIKTILWWQMEREGERERGEEGERRAHCVKWKIYKTNTCNPITKCRRGEDIGPCTNDFLWCILLCI